jgi:cytochrome c peroxidase
MSTRDERLPRGDVNKEKYVMLPIRLEHRQTTILLLATMVATFGLLGCGGGESPEPETKTAEAPAFPQLAGYAEMEVPATNPMTAEKVALGKQLYYDKRLSGDGARSCYGCHLKENGLTDGKPVAIGAFDKTLTRSSPTMWNVGYHSEFYWDGRSPALEKQVQGAWSTGNMGASGNDGAPSMDDICAKLNEIPGYKEQFNAVFGGDATPDNVAMAVASFMRTIVAADSAWVRFRNGDDSAISEQAKRGWVVFSEKAKCTNCHDGLLLTDLQYHNVGIGMDAATPDVGRAKVSGDEKDTGAFKTPTLLDISKSAPYMHNGSVATLEEAVDIMTSGGKANKWLDETNLADAKNANLTAEDKADLIAFLKALDVTYSITEPTLP